METSIVNALELASSGDLAHRHDGEANLKSLSQSPMFFLGMLNIYASHTSYPFIVRWLSIIHMKNTVDSAWRRPNKFGLTPDEKAAVRNLLLEVQKNRDIDMRLHRQLAVVVSRVAKYDFPRNWPEVLDFLSNSIKAAGNEGSLAHINILLETLYRVVKTLAKVKIGMARKSLNEWIVGDNGLTLIFSVYVHLVKQAESQSIAYTALKLIGILLYDGHDRGHRFPGPTSAFVEMLPNLQYLLHHLQSHNESEMAEKLAVRISKICVRMMEKCPLVICNMPNCLELLTFFREYIANAPSKAVGTGISGSKEGLCFEEKLAIQAMHLIRETAHLKPQKQGSILPLNLRPRDDNDRADLAHVYELTARVLTPEYVNMLSESLLANFFEMRPDDVEMWQSDPAEYFFEESVASYDYNVGYAAEMLFGHLLKDFPDSVTPRAQAFIEKSMAEPDNFLRVESALKALEFGAMTFRDAVNLEDMLPQLMTLTHPIVRRRLCLLVSAWINVTSSERLHEIAYKLAIQSLQVGDLVVILAALKLVKACADDLSFSPEQFNTFAAETVFAKCFELLQPQTAVEVKLHVLEVLSVIIESMRSALPPQKIDQILQIIPGLWEVEAQDGKQHALQTVILQNLAALAYAMGANSPQIWPVALMLLNVASDPSQPLFNFLEEDALQLWQALLVNAPDNVDTSSLGSLFSRALDLLEGHTESLELLLRILQNYILLIPALARDNALRIANVLSLYISECNYEDTSILSLLLSDCSLFLTSGITGENSIVLDQTGLLHTVSQRVLAGGREEANFLERVSGAQASVTLSMIADKVPAKAGSLDESIVRAWITTNSAISDPLDRKSSCIASTRILAFNPGLFLHLRDQYLNMWAATVDEIPDDLPSEFENMLSMSSDFDDITMAKRRELANRRMNPYLNMPLRHAISEQIQHLRQGGDVYISALAGTEF